MSRWAPGTQVQLPGRRATGVVVTDPCPSTEPGTQWVCPHGDACTPVRVDGAPGRELRFHHADKLRACAEPAAP